MNRFVLLLLGALLSGNALAAPASAAPTLPGDSVYQLAATLTDQDGHTAPWAARRGAGSGRGLTPGVHRSVDPGDDRATVAAGPLRPAGCSSWT